MIEAFLIGVICLLLWALFIKNLRSSHPISEPEPPKPPEFRLRPRPYGGYYIERWDTLVSMYLVEGVSDSEEEAHRIMKRLKQPIIEVKD